MLTSHLPLDPSEGRKIRSGADGIVIEPPLDFKPKRVDLITNDSATGGSYTTLVATIWEHVSLLGSLPSTLSGW